MPKPATSRKAPASSSVPTRPPIRKRRSQTEINAFLADYPREVQTIVKHARALVLAVAPDVSEQVDTPAKLLGYSYTGTYKDTLCVIMPTSSGVNFGFPHGAEMPDPARLLQGTGKRARHVKLTEPSQVERPGLRALLELAVAMTSEGMSR